METRREDFRAFLESDVWREVLDADPNRHIFATPEWNRRWWEQFGERQSAVALSFADPDPVGLAALSVDDTSEGRRIRFMGGDDLTDYQGPLITGERHRRGVAEAILYYLRDELDDWDYFEAKCLPVPFGFSEWLVEAADRLGMDFELELHELTAVLALPDSKEAYLGGLPKKKRHELERKTRRFEREAPGARVRTATSESLEADLDSFVDLHRTSEGAKGEFFLPKRVEFFKQVARTFQPLGMLALDSLEMDGRVIASTFSLRYDGVLYLYNSAYDQNLRAISPGLMLVWKLIQRSIEERLRRFDFLRGRERYKYDLGAEALPLHWVVIRRST
jgi:CelD/BcsL family acetyltransferase involved in cellulose biosynthesis